MKRRMCALIGVALCVAMALPAVASAAPVKRADANGAVPPKWDQPKPDIKAHADEQPITAGGNGDGHNNIQFGAFEDGDIIVVLGTATGHAGEWDDYYHITDSSYCVWSANTLPGNDVLREAAVKYRTYDEAYGLWVPSVTLTNRVRARNYCRAQNNEPYNISSSKSDQTQWYCSKLVWGSYRYTVSLDLDADGGYWVWPVDLINDPATSVFVHGI